jgi:hypothetical protein
MVKYQLSEHAEDMLRERNISEEWIQFTLNYPEQQEIKEDGTMHYISSVEEYKGKYLRVVVNPNSNPMRIVTAFFDRRVRGTK